MASLACSVIVPTYNRLDTLRRCLDHLAAQTVGADRLEVIVVEDGGSDGTTEAMRAGDDRFGAFHFVRQANAGPAAARNQGLVRASSPLTLFVNDDTLLSPGAVEIHLDEHGRSSKRIVLGSFDFLPDFVSTPFGWLLQHTTVLFQFGALQPGDDADWNFAYTCNLSVPTPVARRVGFDERFTGPAGEDLDFGIRLQQEGWLVRYVPSAQSYHDHRLTPEALGRSARTRGRGSSTFWLKHDRRALNLEWLRQYVGKATEADLQGLALQLRDRLEGVTMDEVADLPESFYVLLGRVMDMGHVLGMLDDPEVHQLAERAQRAAA